LTTSHLMKLLASLLLTYSYIKYPPSIAQVRYSLRRLLLLAM